MKITVKRTFKGPEYTIGKLYIDDNYYCDTLEDTVRNGEKYTERQRYRPGNTK